MAEFRDISITVTMHPFIDCRKISKSFAGSVPAQVLSGITFSVQHGEQVCITGSSGIGKTTLLNIIGILQPPSSGDLWINGRSLSNMSRREIAAFRARSIGYVFQSPALIPVLSARENIEYALRLAQPELDKQQRTILVEEALAMSKLEARRNLRPSQLSGGECQRVAIARAIVKKPLLLLADEPTSQLDDKNAGIVCDIFRELQCVQGSTILTATHDSRILSLGYRRINLQSPEPAAERPSMAEAAAGAAK